MDEFDNENNNNNNNNQINPKKNQPTINLPNNPTNHNNNNNNNSHNQQHPQKNVLMLKKTNSTSTSSSPRSHHNSPPQKHYQQLSTMSYASKAHQSRQQALYEQELYFQTLSIEMSKKMDHSFSTQNIPNNNSDKIDLKINLEQHLPPTIDGINISHFNNLPTITQLHLPSTPIDTITFQIADNTQNHENGQHSGQNSSTNFQINPPNPTRLSNTPSISAHTHSNMNSYQFNHNVNPPWGLGQPSRPLSTTPTAQMGRKQMPFTPGGTTMHTVNVDLALFCNLTFQSSFTALLSTLKLFPYFYSIALLPIDLVSIKAQCIAAAHREWLSQQNQNNNYQNFNNLNNNGILPPHPSLNPTHPVPGAIASTQPLIGTVATAGMIHTSQPPQLLQDPIHPPYKYDFARYVFLRLSQIESIIALTPFMHFNVHVIFITSHANIDNIVDCITCKGGKCVCSPVLNYPNLTLDDLYVIEKICVHLKQIQTKAFSGQTQKSVKNSQFPVNFATPSIFQPNYPESSSVIGATNDVHEIRDVNITRIKILNNIQVPNFFSPHKTLYEKHIQKQQELLHFHTCNYLDLQPLCEQLFIQMIAARLHLIRHTSMLSGKHY